MSKTEDIVKRFILANHLCVADGLYIVALSGGADSVALLLIMRALGFKVEAAHCNFHLRGEESERDEQFCVDLCKNLDVCLHRIHFDTLIYAQKHKVSIEMAARDLRYNYFSQLAKDINADGICVAHHRDDNVETVILNLLRGSGVDGLAGIAPQNGNILRPLLCISRHDILEYLRKNNQEYVTDSTNLEDDALRNKIRHHVIPLLESINPSAKENIAQTARYLRQAKVMLDALDDEDVDNIINVDVFDVDNIKNADEYEKKTTVVSYLKSPILSAASPEYLLHRKLGKYGFHGNVIDNICEELRSEDGGVGKMWETNNSKVVIDREKIWVIPLERLTDIRKEHAFQIPETGNYRISSSTRVKLRQYPRTPDFEVSKASNRITLDADLVSFPLTYRLTKQGDRFHPFGMKGSKLVSDYLTDRKRNYLEKASQHVISDKEGQIIWLVNERTSNLCRITSATMNILEIEIEDK